MDKLAQHDSESYHYEFVGSTTFKQVYQNLERNLNYYRFAKVKKRRSKEVFFDVSSQVLADAGIALSMWIEDGTASLNVRKLSAVKGLNKSEKFLFGYCKLDEQPRDYSYQMAAMIESTIKTPFSADLESIIKQTLPYMEVDQESEKYDIICGTGFRGVMQYENVTYKNLRNGKKVDKVEITFKFPIAESEEKTEFLKAIERYVKGIIPLNISRFECALNLLFPQKNENQVADKPKEENKTEEE